MVTSGQCSISLSSWRLPAYLPLAVVSSGCLPPATPAQSLLAALPVVFHPHRTQSAVPHLSFPYFSGGQQFSGRLGKAGEGIRNVSQESREGKILKNCCCSSLLLNSKSDVTVTWWPVYLGPLPEHPFGVSFVWWSDANSRGACGNQGLSAVVAALLFIFVI